MVKTERLTDRLPGKRTTSRGGSRRTPPPTLFILVRHGVTPTTGRELPGRATGLNLSDTGRQQADSAAAQLGRLYQARQSRDDEHDRDDPTNDTTGTGPTAARPGSRTGRFWKNHRDGEDAKPGTRVPTPVVYASPLERAQQTAAPIARAVGAEVQTEPDLVDLDIGEWTGMELKAAVKRHEWRIIQRHPSGFRFPGGESFLDMQTRMVNTLDRLRAAHPGQLAVLVSHADPIKAVVAHAMGSHLDLFQRIAISPCSLTAIAYSEDGPTVLTVNTAHDGELTSLLAPLLAPLEAPASPT